MSLDQGGRTSGLRWPVDLHSEIVVSEQGVQEYADFLTFDRWPSGAWLSLSRSFDVKRSFFQGGQCGLDSRTTTSGIVQTVRIW